MLDLNEVERWEIHGRHYVEIVIESSPHLVDFCMIKNNDLKSRHDYNYMFH